MSLTFVTNIKLETYPFPKAEERADEGERNGDTEPQRQQSDESGERNSCGAVISPQDQVHDEEQHEHNSASNNNYRISNYSLLKQIAYIENTRAYSLNLRGHSNDIISPKAEWF